MNFNIDSVLEALKKVNEPDLGKDIVSLGLVSNIEISGNIVNFSVLMKNAAMHARKRMEEACAFALERHIGKEISVNVNIKALKKAKAGYSCLGDIFQTKKRFSLLP